MSGRITYCRTGYIPTTVHYLEMHSCPAFVQELPTTSGLRIEHLKQPSLAFYRYLYDLVGSPWQWTQRKLLNDEELKAVIHQPSVRIDVAYVDHEPVGYIELDEQNGNVEIVYFGIAVSCIGRGIGKTLLRHGLQYAWNLPTTRRVWVHTCDLDGPQALPTYVKAGFVKFKEQTEEVATIEPTFAREEPLV